MRDFIVCCGMLCLVCMCFLGVGWGALYEQQLFVTTGSGVGGEGWGGVCGRGGTVEEERRDKENLCEI